MSPLPDQTLAQLHHALLLKRAGVAVHGTGQGVPGDPLRWEFDSVLKERPLAYDPQVVQVALAQVGFSCICLQQWAGEQTSTHQGYETFYWGIHAPWVLLVSASYPVNPDELPVVSLEFVGGCTEAVQATWDGYVREHLSQQVKALADLAEELQHPMRRVGFNVAEEVLDQMRPTRGLGPVLAQLTADSLSEVMGHDAEVERPVLRKPRM